MPWSQSLTRPGKLASAAVEVQPLWRHKTVTEGILEPHREGRFLWLVKMTERSSAVGTQGFKRRRVIHQTAKYLNYFYALAVSAYQRNRNLLS